MRKSLLPFLFLLLLTGCVSGPVKNLWPPKANEANYRVDIVNYDDLHTALVIYPADYDGINKVREYSFGEKSWYMENHRGIFDAFRALFWPNASVIETHELSPEDFQQKMAYARKTWSFQVTKEGREKIFGFLGAWYDKNRLIREKDTAKFFAGKKSYHLFRACHHMSAGALRAGGLPITPWWAYTETLFAFQLQRAEKMEKHQISAQNK